MASGSRWLFAASLWVANKPRAPANDLAFLEQDFDPLKDFPRQDLKWSVVCRSFEWILVTGPGYEDLEECWT